MSQYHKRHPRGGRDSQNEKRPPSSRGTRGVAQPTGSARRQNAGSFNPPPGTRLIIGRNVVLELLKREPARLVRAFVATDTSVLPHGSAPQEAAVTRGSQHAPSRGHAILDALRETGCEITERTRDELTDMVHSDSHQGVVAVVQERPLVELKAFLSAARQLPRSLVLLVDAIQDPQNLGSILRAAECFGVDAVIVSRNRGVGLTPVVAKVSVGASELVTLITVGNLADAAGKCKDAGYWMVAADGTPQASSLSSFEFPERTVLMLGAEGEGLQPLLVKTSDFVVKIPMFGSIDSLNVSQACAVFLAEYRRQRAV